MATTSTAKKNEPILRRGLARPVSRETERLLGTLGGGLMASAGIAALVFSATAENLVANPMLLVAVATAGVVVGSSVVAAGLADLEFSHRYFAELIYVLSLAAPAMISLGQYAVGPSSVIAFVLYVEVPIICVYLMPRRVAVAYIALVLVEAGLVLLLQPGYQAPVSQWLFLTTSLVAIAASFGGLLERGLREAERLTGLRRFLSPQVADAVVSATGAELLRPHRRQIAVIFVDLRGFTSFAGTSEPEDVVELLDAYYASVCSQLTRFEATVGAFIGDGIMAWFNDPMPCHDPPRRAVELAIALRPALHELKASWRRRGFELGFGIGVAYGYATIGMIGAEGRTDYTALGSVVNLAARLSDEAADGEVLVDRRTHLAVENDLVGEPRRLSIKGFAGEVEAFAVADLAHRQLTP